VGSRRVQSAARLCAWQSTPAWSPNGSNAPSFPSCVRRSSARGVSRCRRAGPLESYLARPSEAWPSVRPRCASSPVHRPSRPRPLGPVFPPRERAATFPPGARGYRTSAFVLGWGPEPWRRSARDNNAGPDWLYSRGKSWRCRYRTDPLERGPATLRSTLGGALA